MDDLELLLRQARPDSGHRDRPLSDRAERELEALVGPDPSVPNSPDPSLAAIERDPVARTGGRPRRRRRLTAVVASLAVGAAAIVAAIGIGGALGGSDLEPELVSAPVVTDPSGVLEAAAERIQPPITKAEGSQGEAGPQGDDTAADRGDAPPGAGADTTELVEWFTSGSATPAAQAELLGAIATAERASSAERSTDPAGATIWRVGIDDIALKIHEDSGMVVAVVDADGVEHEVPEPE